MDPIAHTLVGAALAKTKLGDGTPYAAVTLVAAANLPDIDAFAYFVSSDYALLVRRGVTHGPLGFLLLPPLLIALVALLRRGWHRFRPGAPAMPPFASRRLLGLAYLGAFTHPLLDWLNTYGVRLLMPFDERWFYGDVLFIVDPWFWLILASGVVLASRHRWQTNVGWIVAALLASTAVLLAPLPEAARIIWFAAVALLVLLRALRGDKLHRVGTKVAAAALALWLAYIAAMLINSRAARSRVLALAASSSGALLGSTVERALVGPLPATPLRRDVLLQTADGYRFGEFSWLQEPRLRLRPQRLPLLEQREQIEQTLRRLGFEGFANWVRFPTAATDPDDPEQRWILDARYQRSIPQEGSPADIGAVRLPPGD